jgi:hypothetical protein
MEAIKQQEGQAPLVSGHKMPMSRPRMILMGVMALTAFYVTWGIVKVIS